MTNRDELENCAAALESTGDYRVLRRLTVPEATPAYDVSEDERIAVFIDVETTGLDPLVDEVIELGMVVAAYSDISGIGPVTATFQGFREPSVPITEEITAITGITLEMVRGRTLDVDAIDAIVASASIVIAHNAAFDRPFCERISGVFRSKPWACSATEVPWRQLGFQGVKLAYLLYQTGYFHDGHRALDDSVALLKVLAGSGAHQGTTPFHHLLTSARAPRFRLRLRAPYELRDVLRKRGYRWKPQSDEEGGFWIIELSEDTVEQELAFARSQRKIEQQTLKLDKITAFNRYKI